MAEKANQAATEAKTDQKQAKDAKVDKKDAEKHKAMAILAYLIFFLPLVTDAKDSKFAKYHANQGLVLFLFAVLGHVILTVSIIGIVLIPLFSIAVIVFLVLGMINANNLEEKPLPLIGGINLLDK